MTAVCDASLFDRYVESYEAACAQGLACSGETREYFVQQRTELTARLVRDTSDLSISTILDFGCGLGHALPWLEKTFPTCKLVGIDISERAIQFARQRYASKKYEFLTVGQERSKPFADLAYCNGVFHHIPVEERTQAAISIFDSLTPGGMLAFWENNPWNPGTRLVMKRIPFDRDAIVLSSRAAEKLLTDSGFRVLGTRYFFYFPKCLALLRFVETSLERIPFGAQYVTLAQKPSSPSTF